MKSTRRSAAATNAPALAQPFREVASELKIPTSTMALLRARGKGPKCFKVGRRLYVSSQAKAEWIAMLERDAEAAA